jgi:signal transduction histidine kinase
VADGLPTIPGAASELERVFANLIGNALKFHEAGARPRVRIFARLTDDGTAWRFSIEDNGIGIEPRHRERVFKMFQRLHTQDAYPGTGIGLAICERVIERHGGRIWVTESDAGGSAFCFELPVRAPRNR